MANNIITIVSLQLLLFWHISATSWILPQENFKDEQFLSDGNFELRNKRSTSQRKLPNEPKLFKFEISDAVEPSEDVKAWLRQQRESRKSGQTVAEAITTTQRPTSAKIMSKSNNSNNAPKRKSKRIKRTANDDTIKDFNHNGIKLIRFEVTDAREPNELTKVMVKRMRQMELDNLENNNAYAAKTTALPKNNAKSAIFKRNVMQKKDMKSRSKRSTRLNHPQPRMVHFELADARVSYNNNNNQPNNRDGTLQHKSKTMRENRQHKTETFNQTNTIEGRNSTNDDLNSNESKSYYFFEEAPVKVKKAYESYPPEVQHVIKLLNNNILGKSNVKYIPMQQLENGPMKSSVYAVKYRPPTRNHMPAAYVKYSHKNAPPPMPVETSPVNMSPIMVHQANELREQNFNVRYNEHKNDINFRPSKPDTFLEETKNTPFYPVLYQQKENEGHELSSDKISPQFNENQVYYDESNSKAYSQKQQTMEGLSKQYVSHEESITENPLIKIEYHVPANVLQGDYKDYEEFKKLSALVGKSPQDQMHGLTYLLAKEMQNKLNKQSQKSIVEEEPEKSEERQQRPQDSTSPIVFHPNAKAPQPEISNTDFPEIPSEKVYGMAKTKTYVPIVEQNENSLSKVFPTSSSFIQYDLYTPKSHKEYTKSSVVHHPRPMSEPMKSHEAAAVPKVQENHIKYEKLQYASKYTFGYRIRDFHTGNDFGHKQNRDLHGVTRGQYHILLPDGRIQNVIYHADDSGYHADVSFEGESN